MPEVIGALGVGEFNQVLENVVGTRVTGFVPLPVTRIVFVRLQALQATIWVVVVVGCAILVVDLVALEPFLKAHCTHDIVVGHRVEGVEGAFHSLLRAQRHLKRVCSPSRCFSDVVVDLDVLEAPWLENAAVGVVGLGDAVLLVLLVEEKGLRYSTCTLL